MKFKRLLILILTCFSLAPGGTPYWVFLETEANEKNVALSPRAQQRILLRGTESERGNQPVSQTQLAQLRAAGFKIRHTSRFLHAVSIEVEQVAQLSILTSMPFVSSIQPVVQRSIDRNDHRSSNPGLARRTDLSYGSSYVQNELLQIPAIHSMGYDGSGVLIGIFDTGYQTGHPAFSQTDIIAQYDFVDHEPDASGVGHNHGINVLSATGAYLPGEVIGPAYAASYLMARTEDVTIEARSEEDNWVAAMEWADSLGVDIITTSLNYFLEFDDPDENYPASALDGQTTIIAQAANIAAERGILVVNSAGNEGPGVSSIWPPSDSPHVLSVGGVNAQADNVSFSGRGPTFDGRIKPDVVALADNVYMADGLSSYKWGDGTSFAAPQIAGLAALLLQAQPSLSPDSIIRIFQDHGDRASAPNNIYGWGIPDITSFFSKAKGSSSYNCLVYPNPGQSGEIRMVLSNPVSEINNQAILYDILGREIARFETTLETENVVKVSIPSSLLLADQLLVLQVAVNHNIYAGKFVYLKK